VFIFGAFAGVRGASRARFSISRGTKSIPKRTSEFSGARGRHGISLLTAPGQATLGELLEKVSR
jgi:hypothetical protein